ILSPNDTVEEINDKIDVYIAAGVKQVWIVDPHFRTVRVHRPGHKPEFYTDDEDLVAEPDLPGFRVPVAQLFE
ncbi:MAG: Uma2 family endonuclease, partial [Candidatus Saccharimonas sp.]|nr:Uma2 family endonuclease [Planctomycetaceae bacterium]